MHQSQGRHKPRSSSRGDHLPLGSSQPWSKRNGPLGQVVPPLLVQSIAFNQYLGLQILIRHSNLLSKVGLLACPRNTQRKGINSPWADGARHRPRRFSLPRRRTSSSRASSKPPSFGSWRTPLAFGGTQKFRAWCKP